MVYLAEFFMSSCDYLKCENVYWSLDCYTNKCKCCKNKTIEAIPNDTNKIMLTYHQFEVTSNQYLCKKTNKLKTSNKTEHINVTKDVQSI